MLKKFLLIVMCSIGFVGCASVPMASDEDNKLAKEFKKPADDKSGIYIYRSGGPGTALKKDVWINEECVGETAPDIFFYKEVDCDVQHKVSTESEFSPNDLKLTTLCGRNYFVEQYIKMGLFVGGADLKRVTPEHGEGIVRDLDLAISGRCSSTYN